MSKDHNAAAIADGLIAASCADIAQHLIDYAGDPGYSHGDYADTMAQAGAAIKDLEAKLAAAEARTVKSVEAMRDACMKITIHSSASNTDLLRMRDIGTVPAQAGILTDAEIIAQADAHDVTIQSGQHRESPFVEGHDITSNVLNFARAILTATSPDHDALAKDTARYRWLRANRCISAPVKPAEMSYDPPEWIDSAVDALIAKSMDGAK